MQRSTHFWRYQLLTVLSVGLICLPGLVDTAQAQGFTTGAVKGRYAVSITYGSGDASGTGVVEADGNGALQNGWLMFHVPGPTETEAVLPAQFDGQYAVDSNGTALLMARITLPNRVLVRTFDLVVREDDRLGVTELFGAMRER
jgi:hypothetical protein